MFTLPRLGVWCERFLTLLKFSYVDRFGFIPLHLCGTSFTILMVLKISRLHDLVYAGHHVLNLYSAMSLWTSAKLSPSFLWMGYVALDSWNAVLNLAHGLFQVDYEMMTDYEKKCSSLSFLGDRAARITPGCGSSVLLPSV